jgi:4'-phosphopantetheinyl transferase
VNFAKFFPPGSFELPDHNVQVWGVALDRYLPFLADFSALLSPDEQERAARFYFDRHRNRYIVARGILRLLLGGYLEIEPEEIQFQYQACGKPFLPAEPGVRELHFNLSHSENYALIASSWNRRVGVDVEHLRPLPGADSIAGELFCLSEIKLLARQEEEEKQHTFFKLWTAKEAFVKAIGEGLKVPLNQIEVILSPIMPASIIFRNGNRREAGNWRVELFNPTPGRQAALAVESKDWVLNFRELQLS